MKLKFAIIFCIFLVFNNIIFSQKGESSKPNIEGSGRSSTDGYIVSDFVNIDPNPFTDLITIEILEKGEELIQIDILSIVGKVVKNISLPSQNHISINLSDLEKGIYLLKIKNGKFSCVKRIIHQ
jgi:hypothetical protein